MTDEWYIVQVIELTREDAERLRRELVDRGLRAGVLAPTLWYAELPAEPSAEPELEEIEHKDRLR